MNPLIDEPAISLRAREHEDPGIEVRVNFGLFAGRHVTPAEIDELATALSELLPEFSIVAEERHEIGEESEASVNQVRIELAADQLPDDEHELDILCGRLIEAAESWARSCISERHVEISEI